MRPLEQEVNLDNFEIILFWSKSFFPLFFTVCSSGGN